MTGMKQLLASVFQWFNKKRIIITLAALLAVGGGVTTAVVIYQESQAEKYNLLFSVDGEVFDTIIANEQDSVSLPPNPTKEGYTFDGWYLDKDVWSKPFTANSLLDSPISSDVSVYAKFTPIAYTISYEVDGGRHNNPATYTIESRFVFADAQKAGYTFLGWYTDATYTTQIKSISAGTTGDITLYAKVELATYSITYENTKGAENTNPSTYTINSETITFSPLSKDGYTFGGWYVGDTKVMEISKGSTGNLTLTAKWDTIGYSITYHNVDGATHTNPAFYDVEDQPLTLSAASKTGYRFVGWYTDESLTNKVTEIAVGTTGDLDLYAKWEIIEYTATFKDGDTVVGTVKFTVESDSITEPAVPEHTGYTGAWESYTLGAEDITVDAIYTLITYNIVYHNVDGANNTNPSNYDVEDQPLALLDASKDYYTFKGWYTDAEFNNKVTEIAVGTTGVVNLYAKWEAIEYTATFKDGDTVVDTVKFTVESNSINEPGVPEHIGYTGAWESYTLGTEDITVNAVYTLITYGIVYHNVVGATNTNPSNYDVEDQPLALLDASKDYYTFKGWYTDAEFNNKVTEITVGTTGVVNLYAKWEAIEYTATFKDGNTPVGTVKFTVETDSITAPTVPEHTGYTGAWESYTLGTEDITVNAVYTPITYTITYTATKSAANSNVGTYTIERETISLTDLSAVGYTFDGWYDGDTKVTQIPKGSIGNLTLTAKWTPITYTITYTNTKDAINTNVVEYTIESEKITLANISAAGYIFGGWYNGETKVTEIAAGSTENISLTAKWTAIDYTITYHNISGASHSNLNGYSADDQPITLQPASKVGYRFVGWCTDEALENVVTEISLGTIGNLNLYAKWEIIEYTATFKDGDTIVDEIKFTVETVSITEPNVPAHAGYTGKWESYTLGTNDITVDAVYELVTYGIIYHNVTGATHSNPSDYDVEDEPIVLQNANKDYYNFVGWYTDAAFQNKVTEIAIGNTGVINLYAKWEAIEYTATFKDGNTSVGTVKFTVEAESITAPTVPTHAGYTGKWESYTLGTEDIVINAVYTAIVYTIEYENTKNVTNGNTRSYTVESNKITLSDLTLAGYEFVGWFDGDTRITEIPTGSTGNITLTARWNAIKYNIYFLYDDAIGDYADEDKNPATYTIEDEFDFISLVNHTVGYTFDGWFTEKNIGTGIQVTGISKGTMGDITVYAHFGLEEYEITYNNVNGATNTNPTYYTVESDDFTIYPLSKEGYTFDGWFADVDCTLPASLTIVKGSHGAITLYAKWTPIVYTIEYVTYGGTAIGNPSTFIVTDNVTFNDASRSGYVFKGWYTAAEGGSHVTEIVPGTTGNIVLYAHWDYISTINFDSNGGSSVGSISNVEGTTISAPTAPSKTHYIFAGWYSDSALTEKYTFSIQPETDITLYAKWTPVQYQIVYVTNGGSHSNRTTYTVEDSFTLTNASKTGHTFVAWFTDSEFTSAVVSDIKAGASGTITLYANYSINQYTISFEENGGTTVENITQNYATSVITPEAPAKNGYTFAGWYTNSALTSKYSFSTMPASNITLYAKWTLVTYDITYNLNGGSNNTSYPATYTITSSKITLGTPTKTGYTFAGWYTDAEYNTAITEIASGSYGDVELFAKWIATEYTVTYVLKDGATHSNTVVYTIETDLITLADATLKGYTFNGWYADSSYSTPVSTIAGGEIDNITLYAKFTANTYNVWLDGTEEASFNVSFNLNGADGSIATQTITPTKTLKYPTVPSRDGYIFAGWYDNADGTGNLYDFTALITKDITLYAKWVESASSVSMNSTVNVTLNGKEEQRFTFVPLVSGNVTLTTTGSYDTFGILYDETGNILAQDDDTGTDGVNFQIVFNVTAGKAYTIAVRGFSTAVNGTVTLHVSGNNTVTAGGYVITGNKTTVTYGESFTLALPDARDGYKFLGYADTNGVIYTDANGNSVKAWDKDADTLLVSVWERTIYTVTFVTSGGTAIDTVTLAYGDRLDISKYVTTRDGYTFNGWYLDGVEYNATTMSDHNITLTAYWKTFALGTIKYDTDKKAISVNDTITPELFGALCLDTNGNKAEFTVAVNGTQAAGETITVRLTATSGGKTKVITITDIKVYGMPTLTFNNSVDYFNINGGLTASHFGASGTDTFGAATQIKVYVDGEYEAGDRVKIVIESIDPAGNITYGYINNVKAYGLPEITYNENKTAISVNDTLTPALFSATAKDSFGEALTVTVTRYSGTIASGRTVTIRISAKDSKGNVTNIDVQCKVYGMPTISNATKTDVRADDTVTPELLGITATDTYGENLTVTLTTKDGSQTAGTVWTVTATVTDAAGNVTTKDFELKIYGTPTITYDRDAIKVTEDATLIVPCEVSFDLNGGSGSIETQIITPTTGLVYPEIPTRSGYVFKGWYTSADCTTLFDFSENVERDTTVYAGWHQITTSGYGNYVVNIYNGLNSSSSAGGLSTYGTSSSKPRYTYFTILEDGTYTLYYRNGSSSIDARTYFYVYNATQGTTICSNTGISSTSYSNFSFTAKAGDIIYIRTYTSTSTSTSFIIYLTGANIPKAGGMSVATGAAEVLNANATDSFGNPLNITATVKSGSLMARTNIVYTLTVTDHLGNTYSIDTDAIGVYDVNDISLTYSAGMSDLIKLTSKGEEFDAKATDSFGNLCDITIEAATGYTLKGGETITLYLVATDKAGNRVLSEAIDGIKVYDVPTITLNQEDRAITESTDVSFLFTAHDNFGEELYANVTVSGEQSAGNTIIVTVTATDDARNTVSRQFVFGVLSADKPFVELYIDGELWQTMFIDNASEYALPLPEDNEKNGYNICWGDSSGLEYTDFLGKGLVSLPESIQLYAIKYTRIATVAELRNLSVDGKYLLVNDLDIDSAEWIPIGSSSNPFSGIFDGNNHTISNLKRTGDFSIAGLFGYNTGVIKNITVENLTIDLDYSSYSSVSSRYVGGLVSYNDGGIISNCNVSGSISVYSKTDYRYSYAGGLAGYNSGVIENSYSMASVSVRSTSESNTSYAGGLVGYNIGNLTNCYATKSVSASGGYVSSYSYAGGLVGYNSGGNITTCYAVGSVSASAYTEYSSDTSYNRCYSYSYSGGLVGRSSGGTITDCYSKGYVSAVSESTSGTMYNAGVNSSYSYAGGLIGNNSSVITNCYTTGNVNSKVESYYYYEYGSGYIYNYAGGLIGYNSGAITNCYAKGNVTNDSFDSDSGYSSIYAGGLVGYRSGGTITNCYRHSDQSFTVKKGSYNTTTTATNTLGTAKDLSELQSVYFHSYTLGWNSEIWKFIEGEYPTLKNVGETN